MAKSRSKLQQVHDALEALHEVQESILEIADLETDESLLNSEEGDTMPESFFLVGETEEEPERGELAVDTRMHLDLTEAQARELVGDILEQLRRATARDPSVLIALDGRWFMKGKAAKDARKLLAEGGD